MIFLQHFYISLSVLQRHVMPHNLKQTVKIGCGYNMHKFLRKIDIKIQFFAFTIIRIHFSKVNCFNRKSQLFFKKREAIIGVRMIEEE